MIKLDNKYKLVSFHVALDWFAVYASDDYQKPYVLERLAGWALCEFGDDGGQLIGVLPSRKDDYQFAADDADNFLGYLHADESAAKFNAARAEYITRKGKTT